MTYLTEDGIYIRAKRARNGHQWLAEAQHVPFRKDNTDSLFVNGWFHFADTPTAAINEVLAEARADAA